ncbi:Oidioi.mRNA.OKI2018_I69.chr1.g2275.t1.cds [Oikopleura dioica]|uniref:Eukaryotic peptide chain release factor subunit 1 n=1 Tax=Oikopleura dioica TaxID=34765 RepID=A0ABN7SWZ2_OIKDI|nr:Oidioi.mRNA.OKI2018_I69.chr1.g2275.t1.cds [Oikopleura dioica]
MADPDLDQNVQVFKIKRLIRNLEKARGNGTSMISLIIPPKEQVAKQQKMLADEYGTASNIKSRVNRLSVLSAITATQQRLKLYNKVPTNGLVVYCGTIMTDEGKEKKVTIDFEPFKPINTSLYLCDNKFHTEALSDLLTDDNRFGFIVMDGNGALFATLTGNTRDIIQKFDVDLPKKHGRGGQSALRFARLRMEKRHNFVRKVAETAVKCFIKDDKRLAAKVIRTVDVSYGGENGFNQAIELVQDDLSNVKFVQEKKLICQYFDEISRDTGKYCFAIGDTVSALEQGAVETLIIWENLDIKRYVFRNPVSESNEVKYLNQTEERDRKHFVDKSTGQELETVSVEPFIDWLVDTDETNQPNYKQYGTQLEIVTDRSQEGAQFVKGFGGIGGLLRYPVDFAAQEYISDDDDFDLDDYCHGFKKY